MTFEFLECFFEINESDEDHLIEFITFSSRPIGLIVNGWAIVSLPELKPDWSSPVLTQHIIFVLCNLIIINCISFELCYIVASFKIKIER